MTVCITKPLPRRARWGGLGVACRTCATSRKPPVMTKALQILFGAVVSGLLLLWLGHFVVGIPSEGSDADAALQADVLETRLVSLAVGGIPLIVLLLLTGKAYRQQSSRLFYWTFLLGLSYFQVVPVLVIYHGQTTKPLLAPGVYQGIVGAFWLLLAGQLGTGYQLYQGAMPGKGRATLLSHKRG